MLYISTKFCEIISNGIKIIARTRFLAHRSRKLRGAYSIVRLCRPSTISNDFSSKTTGPIVTKFHIQPTGPLGKKNCSNGLGHMTKMATMPIYGKNIKKSSSLEPMDR